MTSAKETREFQVDGTDGIYADKQAEDFLEKNRGHSIRFYRHGEGTCWKCGRYAKLEQTKPAEGIWTLSNKALEERCEWDSIPYANVCENDFVAVHSVNGATYGPPMKIERLTKTQIVIGPHSKETRYRRDNGRIIDRSITCYYVSVVRKKAEVSDEHRGREADH